MNNRVNMDRLELSTSGDLTSPIELHISIYTSIAIQPYLKTHTTFTSNMSLKER